MIIHRKDAKDAKKGKYFSEKPLRSLRLCGEKKHFS
jgi:hypothetical protein